MGGDLEETRLKDGWQESLGKRYVDGLFRMGTDYQYFCVSVNLNYQVNKITDFLDVLHSFQVLVKELI